MQSRDVIFFLLAISATTVASAQSHKLNPPLARAPGEGIDSARVSPDGLWVVYLASTILDPAKPSALYSVPAKGGSLPVRLNEAAARFEISPDSGFVVYEGSDRNLYSTPISKHAPIPLNPPEIIASSFEISADGSRVVYGASDTESYKAELYSAPIDGSSDPIRISGPVLSGVRGPFKLSPDGMRVVYLADQEVLGVFELYGGLLDASSAPVKLSRLTLGGRDVLAFEISPDGQTIAYVADQDKNDVFELFSVPIVGGITPIKLNGPMVEGGDVLWTPGLEFRISPDSKRAVYVADQSADGVVEIYSAYVDQSTSAVRLSGPAVQNFEISPSSRLVVYRASRNRRSRLLCAPIDGSSEEFPLNAPLASTDEVAQFRIDSDGNDVIYLAGPYPSFGLQGTGLFSVSLARGFEVVRLTETLEPSMRIGSSFLISPAGWVVYVQTQFGGPAPVGELLSVPVDGSSSPVLLSALSASQPGGSVLIDGDGDWVVYWADDYPQDGRELFGVPINGGAEPVPVSGPPTPGPVFGDVQSFEIHPDGSHVVFHAQGFENVDSPVIVTDEIYSIALDTGRRPVRLYPPVPPDSALLDDVLRYRISTDGKQVVFLSGFVPAEFYEHLYSMPIDGRRPPIRLDDTAAANEYVSWFDISPDSRWAVYVAYRDDGTQLYGSRTDGSSLERPLSGELAPNGNVFGARVSPDSSRVVYVARYGPQDYELFSVPIDGSASPVRLSGPLVANGDVNPRFEISADGDWVVYAADQEIDERFELYAAPIDGGTRPVKLSVPPVAGGDVAYLGFEQPQFQITPDGRRVLYTADQDTDEVFELYSVPIDRSSAPVKLSGLLVARGDVAHASNLQVLFRFTPDGTRVLYVADQEVDETFELYVVPVDGSKGPRKLSGPLRPGGDVVPLYSSRSFLQFTADGSRVLYLADQDVDETFEIYLAPLDGTRSAKKLNGRLPEGGDVLPGFQISPDDASVVYAADQRADGAFELFEAPLKGGPARRLHGPMVAGGDIAVFSSSPVFEITPDGTSVLYVADQDTDNVFEIYESLLTRPLRREQTPVDTAETSVR